MVHTVWVVDDPDVCAAIADAVAAQPVVIADGHHRYETSLAYRAEREQADGDAGAAAATLAYVVELVEDELTVRAIHRLVDGLPAGTDLVAALEPWFEAIGPPPRRRARHAGDAARPGRCAPSRPAARCCCAPGPRRWPTPATSTRPGSTSPSPPCPSTTSASSTASTTCAPPWPTATPSSACCCGPATVAQIEDTAHGGERMPPKTTFFHPKPPTGLVFRALG